MKIRATLVVLVACLIALLNSFNHRVAGQSQTASTGRLLYTTRDAVNYNVIYSQPDMSNSPQPIAEGNLIWGSGWSPTSQYILITRQEEGRGRIYTWNTENSEALRLTGGTAHHYNPEWSPTGQAVLYTETDGDTTRLILVSPDGKTTRTLYQGDVVFNTWGPDGEHIIVTIKNKPTIVNILTLQAAPIRVQGFEDRSIAITDWHANQIAFTDYTGGTQQLYIANIDGTQVYKVLQESTDNHSLKWSADGSRFVYISTRDSTFGDIYIAQRDGSNIQRLTFSGDSKWIDTLDYWTPGQGHTSASFTSGLLSWNPLNDVVQNRMPVQQDDPLSVSRKVMDLLISGKLTAKSEFVCPFLLSSYENLSEAAKAEFSSPDFSKTTFTVVAQDNHTAHVQLSGTMSVLVSGTRRDFAASLLPVQSNPVTDLYLIYDQRWKLCTPF